MPYEFHTDKQHYFDMQYANAKKYVVPFVEDQINLGEGTTVLEIGCAEAGVLKAFTERGCTCTGIELLQNRYELAQQFMKEEVEAGKLTLISRNIYDIDVEKDLDHKYDLVILKDVIEHIHDQERFIKILGTFLRPGGKVFYGFPPWYMPFGGHQQMCQSKFLSKLPWFHILPMPLYKGVLRLFGESKPKTEAMAEIKETGISIERFERINRRNGYTIPKRKFFLVNPIYEYKFGLKVRSQNRLVAAIPFFRNFFTTAVWYLVQSPNKAGDSKAS